MAEKTKIYSIQNNNTSQTELINQLAMENKELRQQLREVSSLGISMMFHTHRRDCDDFTSDFLKSIVEITQQIEVKNIKTLYQEAYAFAASKSILDSHDQLSKLQTHTGD